MTDDRRETGNGVLDVRRETLEVSAVPVDKLGEIIQAMMGPVLEGLARALEQVAAQQQVQSDRMEALERQIRLQTPVTAKQAGFLNAAARDRAAALLEKKDVSDPAALKKLAGIIRKSVMKRYGIGSMRDVPGYEYRVAMDMIEMWAEPLTVIRIAREAGPKDADS